MKKFGYILIFISLLVNSSCLNRQFVDGRAELVSISDTILNDSILIFGYVYRLGLENNYNYYENEFEVWLENYNLKTTNDTNGYYSIKTIPGIYTIKCQSSFNMWERLIVEFNNIEIPKNKKTQVDFYVGYTIE